MRSENWAIIGVLLVAALLQARATVGQEVRGSVRLGETGEPVSAAVVSLVNDAGATVNRVLTDERGGYRLLARLPGTYELVIERIGLATVSVAAFEIGAGETVIRNVDLDVRPISLQGISVEGHRRCKLARSASGVVHRLWQEARKTLTAVSLLEDAWYVSFTVRRWERDLDPRYGGVLGERVYRRTTIQAHPFESLPPGELVRAGFSRTVGDSVTYFGPDADVLLSDAFLEAYCFRAVPGSRDSVGLGFAPWVPSPAKAEIEGVLWLDRETAALRSIAFEYRNVPSPSERLRSGGSIRFDRLENGAWITSYWNLRIPRHAIVDGLPTREIGLMHESGGEVVRATVGFGANPLARTTGAVRGRLLDDRGVPVADALVYLSGTARADTTDGSGAFRIRDVPPGRYTVAWVHRGDPAAERVRPAVVEVSRRDTAIVLRAATGSYLADACPVAARVQTASVIAGVARSVAGIPLPYASVRVTDGTGRMVELSTDAAGRFHVCRAVSGTLVQLDTGSGTARRFLLFRSGRVVTAEVTAEVGEPGDVPDITVAEDVVTVPPVADGTPGRLVGRVTRAVDGAPVAGAEVRIADSTTVVTDAQGRFLAEDVPAGAVSLRVVHAGFDTREDTVRVEPGGLVELELRMGPTTLEPLLVTARRRGPLVDVYWRMRRNVGGLFLLADEIRRRAPRHTADALGNQPGVHLTTSGTGRSGQISLRGNCAPSVYIDGIRVTHIGDRRSAAAMTEAYDAVNMTHPSSVEVVEIYRGPSELPAQFSGSTGMCGAIALWTRRSVDGRPNRE